MTANVAADNDGAVIRAETPEQLQAMLSYGADGQEFNQTTWQLGQSDNGTYKYTWTVYGLQGAVDTPYTGSVIYNDGTSEDIIWTQPAVVANGTDIVIFPDLLKSRIAKIMTLCTKLAGLGEGLTDEWQSARALFFATRWFNDVIVDGPND